MELNFSFFSKASSAILEWPCEETRIPEGSLDRIDAMHKPVMLKEAIDYLNLRDGSVVVDATLGLGGHSRVIAGIISPNGRLIAIDKDEEALSRAKEELADFSSRCIFAHEDFRNLDAVLEKNRIRGVDAFLFDLGVSSLQLDDRSRGFSFRGEGPLDMRMDRKSYISAYDLLNNLTEEEIASLIYRFGQERFSRRIAHAIVDARRRAPLSTTQELADLIMRVFPGKMRHQRIHPATRTFQALRIAVNRELEALEEALQKAVLFLNPGGRICVISFHSLEDKIVKETFKGLAKTEKFQLLFKKILTPAEEEVRENPRARSAKMRVIERIR